MEIEAFIKKIEQEFDELPADVLKPATNFKESIHWSSINAVVFATMIEFEYHVMITTDDFNKTNTLSELFELVIRRKAGQ